MPEGLEHVERALTLMETASEAIGALEHLRLDLQETLRSLEQSFPVEASYRPSVPRDVVELQAVIGMNLHAVLSALEGDAFGHLRGVVELAAVVWESRRVRLSPLTRVLRALGAGPREPLAADLADLRGKLARGLARWILG